MNIIGIGTVINEANYYEFKSSLIWHLYNCLKGINNSSSFEERKRFNEKLKFKFINHKKNTNYIAELIAIDFDYTNETRFVSYYEGTIRFESCLETITEFEYCNNCDSENDEYYNLFITNNEKFAYGCNTSLMYKIIKEKYKKKGIEIKDLKISTRTKRCLINNNINNIYDLENLSEKDLKHIRNLGQKSIVEIKDKLKEHGLSLREE